MLANVMPGLRELRAPLAAGYLWLVCGWLVFADALPSSDEVGEPLDRLYALEPIISDLGQAVVASVAAYILGSIVIDLQGRLRNLGAEGGIASRLSSRLPLFTLTGRLAVTDAGYRVLDAMFPTSSGEIPAGPTAGQVSQLWRHIERDGAVGAWIKMNRDVTKTRLLDLSASLHSEVDRPDAEATFRMALWPPLAALAIYLAVVMSVWWLVALILPTLLAWQWLSLRRQANDALITAIAARPELSERFIGAIEGSIEKGVDRWRNRPENAIESLTEEVVRPDMPSTAAPPDNGG